jgi:AbrB family looped-hinge helix DNA binding protein
MDRNGPFVLLSYDYLIDRELVMRSSTARLSAKFQISIPKTVRAAKAWKAGQEFAFIPKGEGVLLVPVPSAKELEGSAKGARPLRHRDRNDRF